MLTVVDISTKLRNASDFVDLCAAFGYTAEEHIVQTGDGYLLGVHRLAYRKGEEDEKVNYGKNSVRKNVVYMHHGLLMNSEVWVCLTDEERCLPFKLVEKGYDVWVSLRSHHVGKSADRFSWAIIEETSIQRSPLTIHQQIFRSGISQWMSLHFTISRTALPIFWRPPRLHLCLMLASLKGLLKLLRLWESILD